RRTHPAASLARRPQGPPAALAPASPAAPGCLSRPATANVSNEAGGRLRRERTVPSRTPPSRRGLPRSVRWAVSEGRTGPVISTLLPPPAAVAPPGRGQRRPARVPATGPPRAGGNRSHSPDPLRRDGRRR